MLFRRVILCALFVGLLAGSLLTAVQHLQVLPLIALAERYESAGSAATVEPAGATHGHGDEHQHSHADSHADNDSGAPWEPADGVERSVWTLLANVATAFGLALLLLPLMAAWDMRRQGASPGNGVLWGIAGYLSFFVVPALGLGVEIPGAANTHVTDRQAWWLLTVACSVLAFAAIGLSRDGWRWIALGLLAVPFAIGAPSLGIDPFSGYPPAVAAEMHRIAHQFLIATALAVGVHWLALGAGAGFAVRRWLRPVVLATLNDRAEAKS
jgi:cobalt transporter subunit CbtA